MVCAARLFRLQKVAETAAIGSKKSEGVKGGMRNRGHSSEYKVRAATRSEALSGAKSIGRVRRAVRVSKAEEEVVVGTQEQRVRTTRPSRASRGGTCGRWEELIGRRGMAASPFVELVGSL